jgi:hypothetical protein
MRGVRNLLQGGALLRGGGQHVVGCQVGAGGGGASAARARRANRVLDAGTRAARTRNAVAWQAVARPALRPARLGCIEAGLLPCGGSRRARPARHGRWAGGAGCASRRLPCATERERRCRRRRGWGNEGCATGRRGTGGRSSVKFTGAPHLAQQSLSLRVAQAHRHELPLLLAKHLVWLGKGGKQGMQLALG